MNAGVVLGLGAWLSRVQSTGHCRLHYVLPDETSACMGLMMANGEPRMRFVGSPRWERPRGGERSADVTSSPRRERE